MSPWSRMRTKGRATWSCQQLQIKHAWNMHGQLPRIPALSGLHSRHFLFSLIHLSPAELGNVSVSLSLCISCVRAERAQYLYRFHGETYASSHMRHWPTLAHTQRATHPLTLPLPALSAHVMRPCTDQQAAESLASLRASRMSWISAVHSTTTGLARLEVSRANGDDAAVRSLHMPPWSTPCHLSSWTN